MRMNKTMAVVAAFFFAGPAVAQDGDAAAGEDLYQSVCRNCHGPTAKGLASFPKLVGQGEDYLSSRLVQYRAGERVGPNTALMAPHAEDLSDGDIADIVTYIATLE